MEYDIAWMKAVEEKAMEMARLEKAMQELLDETSGAGKGTESDNSRANPTPNASDNMTQEDQMGGPGSTQPGGTGKDDDTFYELSAGPSWNSVTAPKRE